MCEMCDIAEELWYSEEGYEEYFDDEDSYPYDVEELNWLEKNG